MSRTLLVSVEYKNECCQNAINAITEGNQATTTLRCTEDCPFPCCLDELKDWEFELIKNWAIIEDIITWVNLGMKIADAARWHSQPETTVKRWVDKRKRILHKAQLYKDFQPFIDYITQ